MKTEVFTTRQIDEIFQNKVLKKLKIKANQVIHIGDYFEQKKSNNSSVEVIKYVNLTTQLMQQDKRFAKFNGSSEPLEYSVLSAALAFYKANMS